MADFPKLHNPFPVVGYNGPAYFCNRKKELETLQAAIRNGRNLALIARRRLGKTSLLEHLTHTLRNKWKIIYLDLMKSSSIEDLYKLLATALYEKHSKRFFARVTNFELLNRLRMTIGVNSVTQLPEVSFDLKSSQTRQSLSGLLQWIASEKNVLIIFDEFQQIVNYPEAQAEGFLRAEMTKLPGVRFIFCGSDQHLLGDMFQNPARPFFNSTQIMGLEPIDSADYSTFIQHHFRSRRRSISAEAIQFVLDVAAGETYAVQKICNALFESGMPSITLPLAKETFSKVLLEQQGHYERVRALLRADSVMFQLLRAVARENQVSEPTGKAFMTRHGFHNGSSVRKALQGLESYGLVSKTADGGSLGYYVNDALMRAWLNTLPV